MAIRALNTGRSIGICWNTIDVDVHRQSVLVLSLLVFLALFQGCATNYCGRYYRFSSEQLIYGSCDIPESWQPENDSSSDTNFSETATVAIIHELGPTQETNELGTADSFVIPNNELALGEAERSDDIYSEGDVCALPYQVSNHVLAERIADGLYLAVVSISWLNPWVKMVVISVYAVARPRIIGSVENILNYVL